jgi:NAD(P)-dependent dehydrogenase (short-subunit alcohol dehydrogenase family)
MLMTDRRVALVTGGTRGIGRAITQSLAAQGTYVAAGFSANREAATIVVKESQAAGWTVSVHQGNVGIPEDCSRVAEEVLSRYGRIDYLVNNAGVVLDRSVRKMTIDEWQTVLRVNLSGAFYMTQAVLSHMVDSGFGRIVNITSLIGETGNIGQANYAAAKSGLVGLTKTLALETARAGITVNCVAPGFTETDMLATVPDNILANVVQRIPLRRLGTAAEVAHAVTFLLDDRSGYITGATLSVNGGMDM